MFEIKVPADPMSGEVSSCFIDGIFSRCPVMEEGLGALESLMRTLIPSWGLHLHDLISFPRPLLLTHHLGFLGHTHSGDSRGKEYHRMVSGEMVT